MIVLRFSDYEADTIAEHTTIIADRAYVWWAWWKKRHERLKPDLLNRVRSGVETSPEGQALGLVDRADRRCFRAFCTDVVFDGGHPLEAPDPAHAPAYYRERPFPLWLKFTKIEPIDEEVWIREFGVVPSGDDTLYEAQRPQPAVEAPVLEAQAAEGQRGILHISDLHFGSDHGYTTEKSVIKSAPKLVDRIVGSLSFRPACLVVSGDLTTRGETNGLTSARLFIEGLASRLCIDRNAVVIVPGNHDILIDDPTVTRDFSNEQTFRDQMHLFYGKPWPNERVHDIRDERGRHLIIGALNSSRPRRQETMDYGYVGDDRSLPIFRTIELQAKRPREPVWKALVLHHHVVPSPIVEEPERERPVSLSLDAGELVSFAQRHGVEVIMHGHQHLPFVGAVSRMAECTPEGLGTRPFGVVTILGAGSAGVSSDNGRLPEELGVNTYSLYEPFSGQGLRVSCYGYGRRKDTHELWSFVARQ